LTGCLDKGSDEKLQEIAMTRFPYLIAIGAAMLFVSEAFAQEDNPLTRDEVGVIKKKLVNVLDALGQPATGYALEHENFSLPTNFYKQQGSDSYQLLSASADRTYGTEKKSEKETNDIQKEYQKKFAEAQAKGDYQAMTKLAQEMQKKSGEAQLKAVEEKKDPVEVHVRLNSNPYATIDPDMVLFEHSGVIALKTKDESSSEKERVSIYFDPVTLKNTKQLSRVDFKQPEHGTAKKTAVLNVTVEVAGPIKEIEPWVKNVDVGKVLAQVDQAK
jgi:hypothetical protein